MIGVGWDRLGLGQVRVGSDRVGFGHDGIGAELDTIDRGWVGFRLENVWVLTE